MYERPASTEKMDNDVGLSTIELADDWKWQSLHSAQSIGQFERAIAEQISGFRWFGAKSRRARSITIVDFLSIAPDLCLALARVDFETGTHEIYQLPLAYAEGRAAQEILGHPAASLWARVHAGPAGTLGVIYDALANQAICARLLELFDVPTARVGNRGDIRIWLSSQYSSLRGERALPARSVGAEQSNSSIAYDEQLILKVLRRLEVGLNPDLEVTRYLNHRGFPYVPALAGALEYCFEDQTALCLGILQGYVANQGDGWSTTVAALELWLVQRAGDPPPDISELTIVEQSEQAPPESIARQFGKQLAAADRLGQRTGELHLALGGDYQDPDFSPEPLSPGYRQTLVERAQATLRTTMQSLRDQLSTLPSDVRANAERLLARAAALESPWSALANLSNQVMRIRCHGDYHLGQVLVTGDDYRIIDFEGEPARPLAQRREKQLALVDVAGMMRSFHYASCTAAEQVLHARPVEIAANVRRWAASWYFWSSVVYLGAYRRAVGSAAFVPKSSEEFRSLLSACLLNKAVYELNYELNNRPDWVYLPLAALNELVGD